MSKIAILYNYGEFLGGGDLVMLNILKALGDHGYDVTVITSYPEGLNKSQSFFNVEIDYSNIKVDVVDISKRIPHPYNIALIASKIAKNNKKYDLYIVSDDVPKTLLHFTRKIGSKILVYSHYPHAARIILNELVPFKFKHSFKGRLIWRIHSLMFKYYYLMNWSYENLYALSNSTLTYTHVNKSLNPIHNRILYPPVQVRKLIDKLPSVEKKDNIVYIGRIQPEKGIEDLLDALKILRDEFKQVVRTSIIGFKLSDKYIKYIEDVIRKYSLENIVTLHINAPRHQVLEKLASSKIIVHPAIHEAFGIAVVEGLAAKCTPIVRCSKYGPWRDILNNGQYGYCFREARDLAQKIIMALNKPLDPNSALKRALEFDEKKFNNKIIKVIEEIIQG